VAEIDKVPKAAAHHVRVFDAADLFVSSGANIGDALDADDAPCDGDVYELDPGGQEHGLALARPEKGLSQQVAAGSEIGRAGDRIDLKYQLTLMAPDGQKVDLLLLHLGAGRWVLPLSPIAPRTEYTLLSIETPAQDLQLSDLMCLSFHRGTRITLASGAQVLIEKLEPGMQVLTRDHGPQPLRWIGRTVLRARGSFAPVVIRAGILGNEGDLVVGPHHRLFRYQRKRLPGTLRAELLVQARHLVDDDAVYRREGGFAEYFSLVFDRHEIIYAEGIPVESLLVTEASIWRLPPELAEDVREALPSLSHVQHFAQEPDEDMSAALRGDTLKGRRGT
jgi:hypothetical protein